MWFISCSCMLLSKSTAVVTHWGWRERQKDPDPTGVNESFTIYFHETRISPRVSTWVLLFVFLCSLGSLLSPLQASMEIRCESIKHVIITTNLQYWMTSTCKIWIKALTYDETLFCERKLEFLPFFHIVATFLNTCILYIGT